MLTPLRDDYWRSRRTGNEKVIDSTDGYRSYSGLQLDLSALVKEAGRTYRGTPLELAVGDARPASLWIEFPKAKAPILAVGAETELLLSSRVVKKNIDSITRVVARIDGERTKRYELRLLGSRRRENNLTADLHQLFNRRQSFRVKPGSEMFVSVHLHDRSESDHPAPAECIDISADGIGLKISVEVEEEFCSSVTVDVSLTLPGSARSFTITGAIRNRCLKGTSVQYGIAFDIRSSVDGAAAQSQIVQFVLDRQRKAIRLEEKAGAS
jgi:hypothetical protein